MSSVQQCLIQWNIHRNAQYCWIWYYCRCFISFLYFHYFYLITFKHHHNVYLMSTIVSCLNINAHSLNQNLRKIKETNLFTCHMYPLYENKPSWPIYISNCHFIFTHIDMTIYDYYYYFYYIAKPAHKSLLVTYFE